MHNLDRQAQTGAGARALAAAEGVCAAIERQIRATRIGEVEPRMTGAEKAKRVERVRRLHRTVEAAL